MEKEEKIKRKYYLKDKLFADKCFDDDEIVKLICNSGNYMITAEGGSGKSYISNIWSKALKAYGYRRITAQDIIIGNVNSLVVDNTIIDNLDEISNEDGKKIISNITQRALKNIIIFSRPESVINNENPRFTIITFKNEGNRNPRYEQYGSDVNPFNNLERAFRLTQKVESIEFEYLSIVAFKLLSIGEIHAIEEDLKEITRKFNFHNSSSVNIDLLIEKEIFERNGEIIFFRNKTIASFFVIYFLKKFAHIKNSYLSFFNNFNSQVAFTETGNILKKMGENGLKIAWNLIKNNDFIFPFIQYFSEADGLDAIFKFGATSELKDDFTNVIIRAQVFVSNDSFFKGSFYVLDWDCDIWNSTDFEKYFRAINVSIKLPESRFRANNLFLSWAKRVLTISGNKADEKRVRKLVSTIDWNQQIDSQRDRAWIIDRYVWGIARINEIKANNYENYIGPIESALNFFIKFMAIDEFLELLRAVGYKKANYLIYDSKNFDDIYSFLITIYERGEVDDFIRLWLSIRGDSRFNKRILEKISVTEFIKIASNAPKLREIWEKTILLDRQTHNEIIAKVSGSGSEFQIRRLIRTETENIKIPSIKIDILELRKNIKELKYKPYIERNKLLGRNETKVIDFETNGILHKKTIDHVLEQIWKKYDEPHRDYQYLTLWTDPLIQIISKFRKIEEFELHPKMLLFLNCINSNDNSHWKNNIDNKNRKNFIVNYFSKIENFKEIIDDKDDSYLHEFIIEIISNMKKESDINSAIELLYKNALQDWWYFVYLHFNEYSAAKKAIDEFSWAPKNLYEFISENDKTKLYKFKHMTTLIEIKKYIMELLSSNFTILKNEKSQFTTVEWYDHFIFRSYSNNYDDQMLNLLYENQMIDWYVSEFTKAALGWLTNSEKDLSYSIMVHLYKICYFLNISRKNELINSFIESAPDRQKEILKKSWYSISREFPGGSKVLNISELYRYLNDDLNQIEFYSLFEREVLPIIADIACQTKLRLGNKTTETKIHDEINKILPDILIKRYSIIYQPESNPFVPSKPRKRIDFILTKNSKAIIVELKTLNSIGTNIEFSTQLNNYSQNKLMPSSNCVIVFSLEKVGKRRENNLTNIANSQNFDLKIIEI